MRLAARVGIQVAPVELAQAGGKDVLLVERFDRASPPSGWCRRMMVSALTLFGLDEMQARYASYADLAEMIRARFTEPQATLRELYARLVFNVLVGNTDDHARNHAAFWDGAQLTLTPAYDICPQSRSGRESNQAMLIDGADRSSRLEICRLSANRYLLSDMEAKGIIDGQVQAIIDAWREVCDQAQLSEVDRAFLWRRSSSTTSPSRATRAQKPTGSTEPKSPLNPTLPHALADPQTPASRRSIGSLPSPPLDVGIRIEPKNSSPSTMMLGPQATPR
jgi:serine/threonine-protein kinase HipA